MARDFFGPDMERFLDTRCDWGRWLQLRRGADADPAGELATYKEVLRTAAAVCADVAVRARGHWYEEATLAADGTVVVPPHIADGYERLRAAGLLCLPLDPAYGGYGLPAVVNTMVLEMIARAEPSLMTIVGLQSGVAVDIEKYGDETLKRAYLPRFASGELQGAMDLTEAEAGSDLGGIRTTATRDGDRWRLDGEKIFITNGGAPVHLVLARDAATAEQSKGTTHGLSLLLAPRTLPDGRPNSIRIARVEHKLGIHGSPTCVVQLDGAEGFLLSAPGEGFRAMLDLMNNARLGVAAQAVGIAEGAEQEAREYAATRRQFGVPIQDHPLVKSMLTLMTLNVAAARALLYRTAALVDLAEALRRHLSSPSGAADPDREALQHELERTTQFVRFFTPLTKYHATEISNHVTRQALQVHGGAGFMAESRVGQLHADSIITTIYEGTSEIQASFALKEMGRGALFTTLDALRQELATLRDPHPELVALLGQGMEQITGCTPALMGDPQYALLNAKRVAEMVIDVVVGVELLVQSARTPAGVALAESFIRRRMPAVALGADRIRSGDASRIAEYDRILGLGG